METFIAYPGCIQCDRPRSSPYVSNRYQLRKHRVNVMQPRRRAVLDIVASAESVDAPGTEDVSLDMEGESKKAGLPGAHYEVPPRLPPSLLLKIVKGQTPDAWVNEIIYPLLGWKREEDGTWNDDLVDDEWKEIYPNGPPDFIGTSRNYAPEIDRPVKLANQRLIRSIPLEHKQVLKGVLRPVGFRGWKLNELTPNRTRRTVLVNWIIYWYTVHYPNYEW